MPKRTKDEIALRQSRCPEDWLILADLLEDKGSHAEAAKKRELGTWGRFLFPILGNICNTLTKDAKAGKINPIDTTLPNGQKVRFRRTHKLVLMDILDYKETKYQFIPGHFSFVMDEKGIPRAGREKCKEWQYIMSKLQSMEYMEEYLSQPSIANKKIKNHPSQNDQWSVSDLES